MTEKECSLVFNLFALRWKICDNLMEGVMT